MKTFEILHELSETKTWTTYLATFLVLCLISLLYLVLAPAENTSIPVFFLLLVSLGQLHGIRKRLTDLQDALGRSTGAR